MKVNFYSYHNLASHFSVRGREMWEVNLLFYREAVLKIVIYRVLQRGCSTGIGSGSTVTLSSRLKVGSGRACICKKDDCHPAPKVGEEHCAGVNLCWQWQWSPGCVIPASWLPLAIRGTFHDHSLANCVLYFVNFLEIVLQLVGW